MDICHIIGENLKRIRKERNLSLTDLAGITDFSMAMLIQIEKGELSPSITTVFLLAERLNIPYTTLLESHLAGGEILRYTDIVPQTTSDGQGLAYHYYKTSPHRNFQWTEMTLSIDGFHRPEDSNIQGDKYLLVQEGALTIDIDGKTYPLEKGDSIRFPIASSHIYRNVGTTDLKLSILTYFSLS